MEEDQLTLDLDKCQNVYIVETLKKSNKPITSQIKLDEFTNEAQKNFDYDFNGISTFYPFEITNTIKNLDFSILCIVGASGSGKTTFSKFFGEEEKITWDNSISIMSNFNSPNEAIEKLCAVGFNSIPNWCKPRNVLSVGEGFRVDLARRIKDNCVIDEFTSTIDRNVAISCSNSIGKYIRNKGLKKCVFVSCHKDFIDTLCPDYVIDLDTQKLYDTRGLSKQKFELQIYQAFNKLEIWEMFRQYHYLNGNFNMASNLYVAELNDEIVGMVAILPHPNGYCLNGFRVHRLVILPDYQGLGIGKTLLTWVCEYYNKKGKVMYIRTSHIKLINSLLKSKNWKQTHRSQQISPQQINKKDWETTNRKPYSFEYIKNNIPKEKSKKTSQLTLF